MCTTDYSESAIKHIVTLPLLQLVFEARKETKDGFGDSKYQLFSQFKKLKQLVCKL